MSGLIKLLLITHFFQIQNYESGHGLSKTEKTEILTQHNLYRTELKIEPLQWDESLADYAWEWAKKLEKNCVIKHRPPNSKSGIFYGENIASNDGKRSPSYAVEQWASEKKYFNPKKMNVHKASHTVKVGHYTQIIWRETKKVGCAKVVCKNGDIIIVCNYDPPGNYVGDKVY